MKIFLIIAGVAAIGVLCLYVIRSLSISEMDKVGLAYICGSIIMALTLAGLEAIRK